MKRAIVLILVLLTILVVGYVGWDVVKTRNVNFIIPRAREAFNKGDYARANKLFKSVIVKDPNNEEAVRKLATIAEFENRPALAAIFWQQAMNLNPLDDSLSSKLVRNLYKSKQYKKVIDVMERKPDLNKAKPEDLLDLANSYFHDFRFDDAKNLLIILKKSVPDMLGVQLLDADFLFLENHLEQSKAVYQKVAEENDSETVALAYAGLGHCAFAEGNMKKATFYYKQAAASAEDSFYLKSLLAEHYRRIGENAKAIIEWEKILKDNPSSPVVMINLAELYLASENVTAIEALRSQISPSSYESTKVGHYLNGMLAYMKQDYKETLKFLGWAGDYLDGRQVYHWMWLEAAAAELNLEAILEGVALVKKERYNPVAIEHISKLLADAANRALQSNQKDLARLISKEVLALNKDFTASQVTMMQESLLSGDNFRTIQMANELIHKKETYVIALLSRGRAYFSLNQRDKAKADFQKIVKYAPRFGKGYFWLGMVYFRENEMKSALKYIKKAYEINQDLKSANMLYTIYRTSKDEKNATLLREKLIKSKDPKSRAFGFGLRAQASLEKDNLDAAVKDFEAAIKDSPEKVSNYLTLFELYMESEQYAEAKDLVARGLTHLADNQYLQFDRALWEEKHGDRNAAISMYRNLLRTNPTWTLIHTNLSDLLAADDSTAREALSLAEDAVNYTPKWWGARFILGKRFWEQGRRPAAKEEFRLALEYFPKNPVVLEYLEAQKIDLKK